MRASVDQPIAVKSVEMTKCINRIWGVAWDLLEGESTWYTGRDSYEWYVEWGCYKQRFFLSKIKGSLGGKDYVINLNGITGGYIELVSEELECSYVFTGSEDYGNFSVHGSDYLKRGAAYYQPKSEYRPRRESHEWLKDHNLGDNKEWLMTAEREREAVDFIDRLCGRIEEKKRDG